MIEAMATGADPTNFNRVGEGAQIMGNNSTNYVAIQVNIGDQGASQARHRRTRIVPAPGSDKREARKK